MGWFWKDAAAQEEVMEEGAVESELIAICVSVGVGRGEGIRTCQVSGRVLMLISRRMKARTLAAVQRAGMIVFVVRSRVETSDANILCGGYTCKQPRNLVSR